MVQLESAPVVNENLFTKHYLEERVVNLPEWKDKEEIKQAFKDIKEIYGRKKSILSSCNESQLREEFINPVFRVLGFYLGVEAPVQHGARQPDYALFKDEKDKMEAYQKDGSEDFYQKSVAVADAKAWGVEFDKKTRGGNVFEDRNPSFQIYYYLDSTPPDWGFLTNGKNWRLYYDKIGLSQWFGTYYEVDLIDIIENDSLEDFKYFYLFFRKQAFIPVSDSFLDQAYQGSERYAQEIGESLEDNVYKALRWMAKGYFDMGTNNLEKTKENAKEVHDNSLIFLYRLIFLLYAESNGLLESGGEIPPKYSKYSVYKWAEELLEKWDNDRFDETGAINYFSLSEIFRLVREGSEKQGIPKEEFYIPAYNGGLFDNQKHSFFDKYKIQDGNIAKVVDLLLRTYSEEAGERVWVDYSDLSLRHLGGIYEGLLEHQLKIADQNLVAEGGKKTGKWIPASEAPKDFSKFEKENRKQKGELYLATDKGERKATGSYYTPDYIVKYIVQNTIGPIIEDNLEDAETNEEKRQAILSTNVLDPAMGSGHFLVEAVDFLASRLQEFAENGEEERDIDWAKRKVARNCIYGVDINPLATELAKVSLWLNTMAEDKPLSFLDHHLKTGNSLIGADLHELDKHPEELGEEGEYDRSGLYGKSFQDNIKELLSVSKDIPEISEDSPEDIKKQEQLLRKFESHPSKKKFDVLADVQTSYYFGNEFSKKQYSKLLDVFRVEDLDDIVWEKLSQTEQIKKASDSVPEKREDNLSDEKKFFHWKLEFPEIFFDIEKGTEKDNPGFDAVIGNPPYVSTQEIPEFLREFFRKRFKYIGKEMNTFTLFIENFSEKVVDEGNLSYIVPDSITTVKSYKSLRKYLLKDKKITRLSKVAGGAFKDAIVGDSLILFVRNSKCKENAIKLDKFNEESFIQESEIFQEKLLNFEESPFFLDERKVSLLEKTINDFPKLSEVSTIRDGVKTGDNSKYVTNEPVNENSKKLLTNTDIYRYHYDCDGQYITYNREELDGPREEAIFLEDKIITRQTGDRLICALDQEKYYTLDNTHLILRLVEGYNPKDILGLMNSKLLDMLHNTISGEHGRVYSQIRVSNLEKLPIANPQGKLRPKVEKLINLKNRKKEEKNSFLEWIEAEWNVSIDNLSLKTHLLRYWEYNFGEFMQVAEKNKSKIDGNVKSRKFRELMKKEWRNSMDTLRPLMQEIDKLEKEIDAIVFDLYDLNEEEVITVLDSLETEEEIKEDILEKFREVNN